jgi:xanthine dehydrogenase iron-sulfur cluster and FAD-binding subunit A
VRAVWDHDKLENNLTVKGALARTCREQEENMAGPVSSRSTVQEKAENSSTAARRCCTARQDRRHVAKGGCHQGTCGACSVIIDGELGSPA